MTSTVADAAAMLTALAGRSHTVFTGVSLLRPGGAVAERTVVGTPVVFRPLLRAEVDAYIATGEPFDRAGAYAIQSAAATWIERIEGSYSGIMGLPLFETAALLREAGAMP